MATNILRSTFLNQTMKPYRILLFGILFLISFDLKAQILNLKFTNIRNDNGVFRVGLFADEATYKSGDPKYYLTFSKELVKNGEVQFALDTISPGSYGIVVLDDENSNDKTDYSFLMIPKEGFGLSNYPITKVKIPKFEDFKFDFMDNITVIIQMKYL